MCKVYEFPMKKELSAELKNRMDKITKDYVDLMNETVENLYGENVTAEDYEEFQEVIMVAFLESLEKAIDELV